MNKTRYTLTDADMHLLADFQKADTAFFVAQAALNKADSQHPDYKAVVDRYKNAYQDRLNKAVVFAQCVAVAIGRDTKAIAVPDMTAEERIKLETAEGEI